MRRCLPDAAGGVINDPREGAAMTTEIDRDDRDV